MEERSSVLFLENQLCFPLYAASRLTTKVYAPYLKELEVTYPQYLVLLVLWQYGSQGVKEIGERLLLESNTLTPLLKRLEQKKFLTRSRSKLDERTVEVTLTEKGEKLKEKAICIPLKIAESFRDETISEQEIIQFRATLQKLVQSLDQQLSSGV